MWKKNALSLLPNDEVKTDSFWILNANEFEPKEVETKNEVKVGKDAVKIFLESPGPAGCKTMRGQRLLNAVL